ncbi:MAG: M48 family metallopeptidase [Candidatus Omnitrophica bacterium]|nr:M48 family metallopeptidase [Candidatus Omnitrophota bacterium]
MRRYFFCFSILLIFGCATEYNIATQREEIYFYSTEKEVRLGESLAYEINRRYKLADDPLLQERVKQIGEKVARVSDRKEIKYQFFVLDEKEVNAFALPGGFVYVNRGVLEKADDDELAAVLGHEIGHTVCRHSIKKLQAGWGYSLLMVLLSQVSSESDVIKAFDYAFSEILLGYSRQDEFMADKLGCRYAKLAGFNPKAMVSFLEKLQKLYRNKKPQPLSYIRTHPYIPDRIRIVKQELGEEMGFKDYINIEEKLRQ